MIPAYLLPLANHLWQSSLFTAGVWILALTLRSNGAAVRHRLWFAASAKFLIPFSLLAGVGSHITWRRTPAPTPPPIAVAVAFSQPFVQAITTDIPAGETHAPRPVLDALTLVTGIWIFGFATSLCWWFIRWRRLRLAVQTSVPLNLDFPVHVLSCRGFLEPGVFGLFRPVLLVPDGITDRLSPQHLGAVLAHELCHIRRRDNLTTAVHMFVEALFWFHPLVWWIRLRLIDEQERACDEEVLHTGGDPQVYAESILKICEFCVASPLECVAGVSGGNLRKRIEAIMNHRIVRKLSRAKKLLLAGAGIFAVACPLAVGVMRAPVMLAQSQPVMLAQSQSPSVDRAVPAVPTPQTPVQQDPTPPQVVSRQTAAKPKYEVAAIRLGCAQVVPPGGRSGGGNMSTSGGDLSIQCMRLSQLIQLAYSEYGDDRLVNSGGPSDTQPIRGGPAWVYSDLYTITAKAEGMPDRKTMMGPMLQELLEDRFQLKTHRQTEEVPMYALTAAKGGIKLKPMEPGGCTDPGQPRDGAKLRCNTITTSNNEGNMRLQQNGTLTSLARVLSDTIMDRRVVDKTGIEGIFNIHLEFAPDEATPIPLPLRGPQAAPPDAPAGPSIFTALQEQLGLKLESITGPHGFIVVDSVQRPSEN